MVSPANTPPTPPAPKPAGEADPKNHLARKIAHELNSPLDGVMRFIALAQRKVRDRNFDDIERYLADAEFGLQRMAEILRDLTDAPPRPAAQASTHIDLAELLAQAVRTFSTMAELRHITIHLEQHALPAPRVDVHLYQVLCNLLKNALEAMPLGGTAVISTHYTPTTSAPARLILTITDTGTGIAPQHQAHLFEPFFTTKPQGQGMGLGLTLCRDILTKLNGTITLTNRPTHPGCQATVDLPLHSDSK